MKALALAGLLATLVVAAGCQSPTSTDSSIGYDDAIDMYCSPNPIIADSDTGGKTYRVVRGNNQADDILPYDWHAIFTATVQFNNNATDDDLNIDFPVKVTSATIVVKQATNGIISTPTSDTEHYEYVTMNATGNSVSGVNTPLSVSFEMWYDLPSLRKEAVVQVTYTFEDKDGTAFSLTESFNVAP